jgi:ABC-2 type transport system permease protein
MLKIFRDYLLLVGMHLKGQTSYRSSYFIEILGHIIFMVSHLGGILFIFYHVPEIKGWTLWEVVYLYGLTTLSFTLAQLGAEAFEDMHLYVKTGDFDRFLLRPTSPLLQMASLSFRIDRLGGVLQGLIVLLLAGYKSGAFASPAHCLLVLCSVVSMVMVYYGLFLVNGAFCFWTLENSEAFNAFTYGGVELGKYPLPIYRNWMQNLFLYFIPLGFVSYLPAAEIFGKNSDLAISTTSGRWAPVVAAIFLGLVWRLWHFSLKHYQSTGS